MERQTKGTATTLDQRIEAARKKAEQIKAQLANLEARKRMLESKTKRQDDTRRKILLGSLFLQEMEQDEITRQDVMRRLNRFLTREHDRRLFSLADKKPESGATSSGD
jgi:hypothetical protein